MRARIAPFAAALLLSAVLATSASAQGVAWRKWNAGLQSASSTGRACSCGRRRFPVDSRSDFNSYGVSGRNSPTFKPFIVTSPIAIRLSVSTLWPTFAKMRRISRFFPSLSTISSSVLCGSSFLT